MWLKYPRMSASNLLRDDGLPQRAQRVVGASSRPKSIRAIEEVCLEHGFEDPPYRPLHQSVFDRRDTQRSRSDLARSFRDLHPAHRRSLVGSGFQAATDVLDSGSQLAFELLDRLPVHSACTLPVELSPRLFQELRRQPMGQRGEAKLTVCLGLRVDLSQLRGHPFPTSGCRGCVPGSESRPAPPLPPVHGSPVLRVLPAGPTSTAASAPLWMVLSVGILGRRAARPRPRWISQVPWRFRLRPCRALRPRRSLRQPSPFAVAYWCLPSFRPRRPPVRVTGLDRFTRVTARTSLCLRLVHVVASMNPRLDSRWDGSFPLPGRESHPLEAPGLSWRTEELLEVHVRHPAPALLHKPLRRAHRIVGAPSRPEAVTVL